DIIFSDKIYTSFSVKIDESGAGFSAFIKITPIQNTLNKRYRDKYCKWRLTRIKSIFYPTYDFHNHEKKICTLYSTLDYDQRSFNRLLLRGETEEHRIYSDATCIYVARATEETQWFSTQTTPPSMCTILFFGAVSDFPKNIEIGKVRFESYVQYKEIADEQADTIINDQYQFYGNGELDFERIKNREAVSENDSRGDQPEIIELSNDEDQIPDIIEISSDEEGQTPKIIELSSDEEMLFEKGQIAVSRDRTPETANKKIKSIAYLNFDSIPVIMSINFCSILYIV
ncbi:13996_t:CDS:1, partial [Gigaspora rosea]